MCSYNGSNKFEIVDGVLIKYLSISIVAIVPEGVKEIGREAFFGHEYITRVEIPDTVKKIGEFAFYDCPCLEEVIIHGKLTSIGRYAFAHCKSLVKIVIPDGVRRIGEHLFDACKMLKEVILPEGVRSIGNHAFSGCEALEAITLPDSVTKIERSAFGDCESMKRIVIPNSVKKIEGYAFWGCDALMEITIPDSVEIVKDSSFFNSRSHGTVVNCSLKWITKYGEVTDLTELFMRGRLERYKRGEIFASDVAETIEFIENRMNKLPLEFIEFPQLVYMVTKSNAISVKNAEILQEKCKNIECRSIFLTYINAVGGSGDAFDRLEL